MRKLSRCAIGIALSGLMVVSMPSAIAAPATATGAVDGTVTITSPASGIPTDPNAACVTTNYTFGAITLAGLFRSNDGSQSWAGAFGTNNVSGGSYANTECATSGSGYVASSGTPATFSGTNATGTISGSYYGTYQRIGSVVVVTLTFNATVDGAPASGTVLVTAQFTPTHINQGTRGILAANFAGSFNSL